MFGNITHPNSHIMFTTKFRYEIIKDNDTIKRKKEEDRYGNFT